MDGSHIWATAKGTPGETQDQQPNTVEESPFTPPTGPTRKTTEELTRTRA